MGTVRDDIRADQDGLYVTCRESVYAVLRRSLRTLRWACIWYIADPTKGTGQQSGWQPSLLVCSVESHVRTVRFTVCARRLLINQFIYFCRK